MAEFIFGCFVGGFIGMSLMSCLKVASHDDDIHGRDFK